MKKEFSAGAIIFRRENGYVLFLLVYSGRNNIWGFPKGHIEPGESEKDSTLREVKEETGITYLTFLDGYREEVIYQAVSNRVSQLATPIEKHSIYYLCETKTTNVAVDKDEVTDYKWLGLIDANKLLPFDSLKRLLIKAEEFTQANIDQHPT